MNHLRSRGAVGLSLLVAFSGCAGSGQSADSPAAGSMSPADARAFIAEVQRERGIPIDQTSVTSIEQVLQVVGDDQVGRFSSATQVVAGKPGIEALTIHAIIELAWSDDFTTFARILAELEKRAAFEVDRLSKKSETSQALTDAEAKGMEQNKRNAAFDAKAKLALELLAAEHLHSAADLVDQALRQYPKEEMTYRVAAYLSLLSREWPNFDTAMSWFADTEAKDAGLVYLRALEALNRRRVPKNATALFREALRLNPKMVRAQAKLVLSEDGIDAKYGEFEKLRAVAPEHPMVSLLGPSIISDFELSSSFREALAARQAPAAIGSAAPPPPPVAQ
jgi:tetratricopeptide (TPR) repeat protein